MTDDALRADRDRLLVMLTDYAAAHLRAAQRGRPFDVPEAVVVELRGRLADVDDARERLAKGTQ